MSYRRRNRQKEATQKQTQEEQQIEFSIAENIRIDLKESFEFFDKKKKGAITRDNLKSIMGNFGWFNCSSSDLEKAIDELFPPKDSNTSNRKQDFSFQEVKNL